jgi:hypothetical protein
MNINSFKVLLWKYFYWEGQSAKARLQWMANKQIHLK